MVKLVKEARIRRVNYLKRKSKPYISVLNGKFCFKDHNILVFKNTTPDKITWFAHRYLMTFIERGIKFRLKINNK